jgi:hypothetical protein
LLGLNRQQWQGDRSNPIDLKPRHDDFGRAVGEEIASPVDRSQNVGKVSDNR